MAKESHFPFTVLDLGISTLMFQLFINELTMKAKDDQLVLAELGTGVCQGTRFTRADFSTEKFLIKIYYQKEVLLEEGAK